MDFIIIKKNKLNLKNKNIVEKIMSLNNIKIGIYKYCLFFKTFN